MSTSASHRVVVQVEYPIHALVAVSELTADADEPSANGCSVRMSRIVDTQHAVNGCRERASNRRDFLRVCLAWPEYSIIHDETRRYELQVISPNTHASNLPP